LPRSSVPPRMSGCNAVLIGVDEAGRGPLLGDLVIAAVAVESSDAELLAELGVRDSKELTPEKRAALVKRIASTALAVHTRYIPPALVDKHNLNKLVASNMAEAVVVVAKILRNTLGEFTARVYVDEVKGFENYIKNRILAATGLRSIEVVVEPGADKKYVAVSAASIVAKVARDSNLAVYRRFYGDFGSGYPSDPRTRAWVVEAYKTYRDPPLMVRRSWKTLASIAPEWYRDLKRGVSILDFIKKK